MVRGLTLLLLFPMTSHAAANQAWVSCSNLTVGYDNVQRTSYTSASITPSANALVLAWVDSQGASTPTLSGNGLTWVQIDTKASGNNSNRITLYRAMGSSPSAGTVTMNFNGNTQDFANWSINQCTNVDTSGTNGSGAVIQYADNENDNATSLTVTLGAFASAHNATVVGFHAGSNETPPTDSFSQLGTYTYSQPVYVEWRKSNSTTATLAQTFAYMFAGIAVEVKYGSSPTTFTPRSWTYRKRCTIDKSMVSNTNQSNFPVFFYRASDSQLSSKAQSDGDDIVFTSSDGKTQLSHEIESYTNGTGELEAWVKIPTLSASTNTVIYMYYGNSSAVDEQDPGSVWDSNYKAVWHLGETSGTINEDSTTNDNTGQKVDATHPNPATGKITDGADFEHDNPDYENVGPVTSLQITGSETVSGWFKIESNPADDADMFTYSSASDAAMQFKTTPDTGPRTTGFRISSNCSTGITRYGGTTLSTATWYHFAGVYDASGQTMHVYLNGSADDGTLSGTVPASQCVDSGGQAYMAKRADNGGYEFDGIIDELRVSNTNRSADWIKTEYNNQNAPTTYITCSGQLRSHDKAPPSPF